MPLVSVELHITQNTRHTVMKLGGESFCTVMPSLGSMTAAGNVNDVTVHSRVRGQFMW